MNRNLVSDVRVRSWVASALAAVILLLSWGTSLTFAQGADPAVLPVVSLKAVQSETTEPSITSKIAPARFLVQRSGDLSQTLHVYLELSGTARAGFDYVTPESRVDLPAGAESAEVIIAPLDDDLVEGLETVVVQIVDPPTDNIPNYIIDRVASTIRLVIHDNDAPDGLPVIGLQTVVGVTSEPNPLALIVPGTVRLNRTGTTVGTLMVGIQVQGTATPGKDYVIRVGNLDRSFEVGSGGILTVPMPAGESSLTLYILGVADDLVEGDESIVLTLVPSLVATPTGGYRIDPQATVSKLVLHDMDRPAGATIEIVQPREGQTFAQGAPIEIDAVAVDPRGYIPHVDFYAGDKKIGESTINFIVAPEPGTPIRHSFVWKDAPVGAHVLTVRAELPEGGSVRSKPVGIVVVAEPVLPVVSISYIATPFAVPNTDFAPGYFLIERTGATTRPLGVYLKTGGTATAGVDYKELPPLVWIPEGKESVTVAIEAIDDKLPETQESVSVTLIQPPADAVEPVSERYRIDPLKSSAQLIMFDNDRASEIASLEIVTPKDGDILGFGSEVRIVAVAVDKLADIRRVEFFDGDRLIGVSLHLTKDAVVPGRPREHVFVWQGASVGVHELWACALDSEGGTVVSKRVSIRIAEFPTQVGLAVIARDPLAKENGLNGEVPDPAVFTIRRVNGPLNVDVMVQYVMGGVASNGVDYETLPGQVLLPKGAESVDVVVTPIPDKALEGDEVVVLELQSPACIAIFPPPPQCYLIVGDGVARAVIQDSKPSENLPPKIVITKPAGGDSFKLNENISLVAEGSDPDGFITRVEFYDGRMKIGEVSRRVGDLSLPLRAQAFRLVWKDAEAGKHTLTARATDDDGSTSVSAPVEIIVAPDVLRPIVTVVEWDAHAVEPIRPGELNTASFQVRRSGSTDEPLTVFYSLDGTAAEGKDYEVLPHQVVIPAGRSSVFVTVTPVDDSVKERTESVILQIVESPVAGPIPPYLIGRPAIARAVIADAGWVMPLGDAQCVELPGGITHLCFPGADGSRFRVEASDDLVTWETVLHATAIDGACHFVDGTSPDRSRRFYRAVPLPASEDPAAP